MEEMDRKHMKTILASYLRHDGPIFISGVVYAEKTL